MGLLGFKMENCFDPKSNLLKVRIILVSFFLSGFSSDASPLSSLPALPPCHPHPTPPLPEF